MYLKTMTTIGLFLWVSVSLAPAQTAPKAPSNAPAAIEIAAGKIVIRYDGRPIFEGAVAAGEGTLQHRLNVFRRGERIEQVLLLTSSSQRQRMKLAGTIFGGGGSFACEIDRPNRGPLLVRHASGPSRSLRNWAQALHELGLVSLELKPRNSSKLLGIVLDLRPENSYTIV